MVKRILKCVVCQGNGKQHLTAHEAGKPDCHMDIKCVWCNGTGEMTQAQFEKKKRIDNAWCKCKEPGDPIFYDQGGYHGYNCSICGKLLQTG
jgi:DnaJ-class molecular chaperone